MSKRTVVVSGDRTSLVVMTEDDQPLFHSWHTSNEELRLMIDDNTLPSMEDQLRWFERSKQSDRALFSVVTEPENVLIGHGGLVDLDDARTGQLRITIGNADFWGKGLGTEATMLIVRYGFETLHLTSIWLRVLRTNIRAIRVYEKAGFVQTGEEDNSLIFEIRNSV